MTLMARNGLLCAAVPLRNYSLVISATHHQYQIILLGDRGTCVCEQLAQSRYIKASE